MPRLLILVGILIFAFAPVVQPGEHEAQQELRSGEKVSTALATVTTTALYCFFMIAHDRRRILHFNVTKHPTSLWIVRQLREAFPFDSAPRFLIFDRDAKYGLEVPAAVRSLKINPVQTSFESPCQNGIAERRVGSAAVSCWITSFPSMKAI